MLDLESTLARLRFWYRAWNYRTRVEPAEISFLLKSLCLGEMALDIGAHKGAFTYWMHRVVGPSGQVVAFEPQPELSTYLLKMKQVARLDNVTVEAKGVSDRAGSMRLTRPSDSPSPGATLVPGNGHHQTSLQVPVCCIDEYLGRRSSLRVAFIKCDVEGHELAVFQGARKTLLRDRPVLMFECERRHHQDACVDHVFAYLEALGYEGKCFHRGATHSIQRWRHPGNQLPGTKDYINNFCFFPSARAA